ncbi:MAG TPA: D-glycerate dehydrogenase [Pseudolysinimonas sp.]|nr:D-glycerate dehydrogenase [Pseudolysinimonas sp.]
MARCIVTRALPGDAVARLSREHDVITWDGAEPPTSEELRDLVADADALLSLLSDRVDADLMDASPRLRVVANYAVGYDNIDVAAAERRGIVVTNTPDILTDATADHAFALLAAVARRIGEGDDYVRRGEWQGWHPLLLLGKPIFGARIGIVGMGRIGRAVAERAKGFGMEVLPYRRGDGPEVLRDLLATSDFITLHCPLTDETRHLIDAAAIETMNDDAILINTARGGLVDLHALASALVAGTVGGAGLDTTDPEPISTDHPILRAPRTIITPHIGSATTHARTAMADMAVDNLLAVLADHEPLNPVTEVLTNPRRT